MKHRRAMKHILTGVLFSSLLFSSQGFAAHCTLTGYDNQLGIFLDRIGVFTLTGFSSQGIPFEDEEDEYTLSLGIGSSHCLSSFASGNELWLDFTASFDSTDIEGNIRSDLSPRIFLYEGTGSGNRAGIGIDYRSAAGKCQLTGYDNEIYATLDSYSRDQTIDIEIVGEERTGTDGTGLSLGGQHCLSHSGAEWWLGGSISSDSGEVDSSDRDIRTIFIGTERRAALAGRCQKTGYDNAFVFGIANTKVASSGTSANGTGLGLGVNQCLSHNSGTEWWFTAAIVSIASYEVSGDTPVTDIASSSTTIGVSALIH